MTANEAQRQQWNSPVQAATWPKRERITETITGALLERAALQPGERVLDVGCGGGVAALAAGPLVGPSGHVTGFDLSVPLAELATRRAAEAKLEHVRFATGDAQTDDISGAPFDAVMSQFGVMFFADPVAAFTNLRRHLRAGGRLVFVCWQPAAKNGWFPGLALARYQQRPPAPAVNDGPPPGPFAFGDAAYVSEILERAGFTGIEHAELTRDIAVPEDLLIDDFVIDGLRLDKARAEEARQDLRKLADTFRGADGLLHLHLASQIFAAGNV